MTKKIEHLPAIMLPARANETRRGKKKRKDTKIIHEGREGGKHHSLIPFPLYPVD